MKLNFSKEDFKKFIDYVINRHFPDLLDEKLPYLELIKLVMIFRIVFFQTKDLLKTISA